MKRKPLKKAPRLATRYVAATGAPLSDADAAKYGPELLRIAKANNVDDVRSLDKRMVYEIVIGDPKNPLRDFVFHSSDEDAAASHRVDRCGLLIRSVRIITVSAGERSKPVPMFLHVPEHHAPRTGAVPPRSHVLTADVLARDPEFAAFVSGQIRIIMNAVGKLENITSMRPSPREVVTLREALRRDLDAYMGIVQGMSEAAE